MATSTLPQAPAPVHSTPTACTCNACDACSARILAGLSWIPGPERSVRAIQARKAAERPSTPPCPFCGSPTRQTRRGATLKRRGPAYTCSDRGPVGDRCLGATWSWSAEALVELRADLDTPPVVAEADREMVAVGHDDREGLTDREAEPFELELRTLSAWDFHVAALEERIAPEWAIGGAR